MRKIILDGNKMTTIAETHGYMKAELGFPDYYGNNLDALWDVLSTESMPESIHLINTDAFISNVGMYAIRVINIFHEAAGCNENIEFGTDVSILE